ncbi:MAG TPA: ATP-dependent Clp protease ATP-binding subunit ClpX, partial [Spirochaetota bacterium]|nr:ATP-dependent Clp protease ATP-binding subunit ClpX [Spirochaetota bacterium]
PINAVLHELDNEAMKRILTEPKNALIKQYEKMFSFEDVELQFEDEAITEIANIAIERESGARGLRAVLEKVMMDLMYEIPSKESISKVVINRDTVSENKDPVIEYKSEEKSA